ncbi:MAG: VOC family protein [Candidatus Velthaea sp.]
MGADDVERARRFYESVFGWKFEAWGPPHFYMIQTGDDADRGIHGSLQKRHEPMAAGGMNRYECTVEVLDLSAIRAAIVASGGTITLEPFEIPGVGTLIAFTDTEGNTANAMRYAKTSSQQRAPSG